MMKYYLCIALFFLLNFCFAEDYIIEFQAKVKNLKEFRENLHTQVRTKNSKLSTIGPDNYLQNK